MEKEVTQQDYKRFKKLLEFFVNQANKNANSKLARLEKPFYSTEHLDFRKYYGLEENYNEIAGSSFVVRFASNRERDFGKFGEPRSTYINKGRMNIVGDFSNKQIKKLKNEFVLLNEEMDEKYGIKIAKDVRQKIKERNNLCKSYSPDELGLGDGKEPNDKLKEFLGEYIEMYEEFPKFP
jgi:hypothetical protein